MANVKISISNVFISPVQRRVIDSFLIFVSFYFCLCYNSLQLYKPWPNGFPMKQIVFDLQLKTKTYEKKVSSARYDQ